MEDIDNNSKVNIIDVSWAASCFGYAYPTQWNSTASLADITGPARVPDNKVNILDISQIAKKFGWKSPP